MPTGRSSVCIVKPNMPKTQTMAMVPPSPFLDARPIPPPIPQNPETIKAQQKAAKLGTGALSFPLLNLPG